MKQLLTLLVISLSITACAQKEIPLDQVTKHIGESVMVRSKIKSVWYIQGAVDSPTFINLGGLYPRQTLTIVIWGGVQKKLGFAPEAKPYSDDTARITDKVILYDGKPEITVSDPAQLSIAYDEDVPASEVPPIPNN